MDRSKTLNYMDFHKKDKTGKFPAIKNEMPNDIVIFETRRDAQSAAESHEQEMKFKHTLVIEKKEIRCKEDDCRKAWRWNKEN